MAGECMGSSHAHTAGRLRRRRRRGRRSHAADACPGLADRLPGVSVIYVPGNHEFWWDRGEERYTLKFDCKPCEMHVVGAMKPNILAAPPPSNIPYSPLVFHKQRPRVS